ncbi:MAG: iron-sulfur cluster assembly protein, partial [Gemmatimonadales bacterium]
MRGLVRHPQAGHRGAPARAGSRGQARGGGLVAESLESRVTAALAAIRNSRLENDILSAGMVRDLTVSSAGDVSFTFLLA